MNEVVERLCELVSPPKVPIYNKGSWVVIEAELGLQLPQEYKRLIELFGQGGFVGEPYCSGLQIISYLGGRALERAKGFAAYFSSIGPLPYQVYPDHPGLLGFGSYGDKDTIAWHTTGSPDKWVIVWHDPETGLHEIRGIGLIALVISILEETSPLHKKGIIRKGNMKAPHAFCPEP